MLLMPPVRLGESKAQNNLSRSEEKFENLFTSSLVHHDVMLTPLAFKKSEHSCQLKGVMGETGGVPGTSASLNDFACTVIVNGQHQHATYSCCENVCAIPACPVLVCS